MKKNYIVPQTEAMQLSSELVMQTINIVHHSGGGGNQDSGFDESQQL